MCAAQQAGRPRFMFELDDSVSVDPRKDFDDGEDRWRKQEKLEKFRQIRDLIEEKIILETAQKIYLYNGL